MLPSLKSGQLILVSNSMTQDLTGQMVIFSHNGLDKIKRVKTIDDNLVYLLGDNLEFSHDSRQFGYISKEQLIGRVIWPKKITNR